MPHETAAISAHSVYIILSWQFYLNCKKKICFVVFQLTDEEEIKEHIRECETRIQLGNHTPFFNTVKFDK